MIVVLDVNTIIVAKISITATCSWASPLRSGISILNKYAVKLNNYIIFSPVKTPSILQIMPSPPVVVYSQPEDAEVETLDVEDSCPVVTSEVEVTSDTIVEATLVEIDPIKVEPVVEIDPVVLIVVVEEDMVVTSFGQAPFP